MITGSRTARISSRTSSPRCFHSADLTKSLGLISLSLHFADFVDDVAEVVLSPEAFEEHGREAERDLVFRLRRLGQQPPDGSALVRVHQLPQLRTEQERGNVAYRIALAVVREDIAAVVSFSLPEVVRPLRR